MEKLLKNDLLSPYVSMLDIDLNDAFSSIKQKEWTADNFKFATAVSVMSSSRIEGETLEVDSYVKHKVLNIEYLPNLTEKPNDLYAAYEFARDNRLSLSNFYKAHSIATRQLLPEAQRGVIRTGNMLIMEQQSQRIQYEAAPASIVKKEFERFWDELETLLAGSPGPEEIFYYASYIHLVFVKIHPFNDGNGRAARLLEKWFLSSHLGQNAWYIASEYYYYHNLQAYYNNLARTGLFYEDLKYEKALPFLLMLPKALEIQYKSS
ncbi:Fic family protein [Candidatus Kuenenia sp.]|uniref:Fic family protein n=1 Tax=Candidatus Kuenenia sp. TaxID=2499824 RepID=UPI00321F7064